MDRLDAFSTASSAWSIRLRRPLVRLSDDDAQLQGIALAEVASSATPVRDYTRWYATA